MARVLFIWPFLSSALSLVSCSEGHLEWDRPEDGSPGRDVIVQADGDADVDGDIDGDGDIDSDADIETDADIDVELPADADLARDADRDQDEPRRRDVDLSPVVGCHNQADQAALATIDVEGTVEVCVGQCQSDPTVACISGCFQAETSLSSACVACFTSFANCGLNSCLIVCAEGIDTPLCEQCLVASCGQAYQSCTGLEW